MQITPKPYKYRGQNSALRESVVGFLRNEHSDFNYAASLTFLREVHNKDYAKKIGLRFQQNYNNALGMQNWQRKYKMHEGERAPLVAILEGDGVYKHFHYHFMLSKPENISDEEFTELVESAWKKTGNGSLHANSVLPIWDFNGWTDYISKEFSSANTDKVHWGATHIFTEKN